MPSKAPARYNIDAPDPEALRKGASRSGPVFLLRAAGLLLLLAAIQVGGLESVALLRVLAGSPTPWARRLDFAWGNWAIPDFKPLSLVITRTVTLAFAGLLFLATASALHKAKRSAYYAGLALTIVVLILSALYLASNIWYVWSMLANESGAAFGQPNPVWKDLPLPLPILTFLLDILLLINLRLLTRLRIDLLH